MQPVQGNGYVISVDGLWGWIPHNCRAIMERSDPPSYGTPTEKLHDRLRSGVFLDQKRQKYWIDPKTGYNCFMLFARDLSIIWGDDKRYWKWASFQETSNVLVEIADLTKVCWLEVHGKLDISNLSPGVMYEVAFVVMLKDTAHGWDVPVNLELILPDGKKQEHEEALLSMPKEQLVEILVGEFKTCQDMGGDMKFSLTEIKSRQWKTGLVLKGVIIRPKTSCNNQIQGNNLFTIIPKDLSIVWAEDQRYWRWFCIPETSGDIYLEVPELLDVCWLEVNGKFNTAQLTPGIVYEAVFLVMLKDPEHGWEVPVNLQLVLPDGEKQERKECLLNLPKGKWMELKIGEFKIYAGNAGDIQFSLFEIASLHWKKGLTIKSVVIRPKN